jgi:xylitol oxidase
VQNLQRNWAGNYQYTTNQIHQPKTPEEVQELVARAKKIRALGTRHSFNSIADSDHELISLQHLDQVISLDKERLTVTVDGGLRYEKLCQFLHREGFALHNLASLPHISIAGACATATHGSGNKNGNLATAVSGMELVVADGSTITLSREKDSASFPGLVVGLGGLGVVTKLTLDIQPAFEVAQNVYLNLPFSELEHHFNDIMESGYSVSLFTDWERETINQVWVKRIASDGKRLEAESNFLGASPAKRHLHPIAEIPAENCTGQMGVPGPWHERLPHFRMDHTPSSGVELQSEYFVPRKYAFDALLAVSRLREQVTPLLLISETRTIAADDLWMSPCYGQDSVAIHFTWKKDEPAVMGLLPQIEAALAPFEARPHWGKLFTMLPQEIEVHYEKLQDFRNLVLEYDPSGKFRNAFLSKYIFGL